MHSSIMHFANDICIYSKRHYFNIVYEPVTRIQLLMYIE